jgi:hypothetical protein
MEKPSALVNLTLTQIEVSKHKTTAEHDFSDFHRQIVLVHRSCIDGGWLMLDPDHRNHLIGSAPRFGCCIL